MQQRKATINGAESFSFTTKRSTVQATRAYCSYDMHNMPTDKIDTPDFRCNESVQLLTFEAFNRMYPEFRRYSFNSDSYQSLFEYFVFLSHSACLQLSCPKSWPRAVPQEIHGDISFHQHATTMCQCFQNKIFTTSSNWVLSGGQELRD